MAPASEHPRPRAAQLGSELRRLRKQSGLSQDEFTEATGASQSKISRLETGQTVARDDDINRWADATNATPAERDHLLQLARDARVEIIPLQMGRDTTGVGTADMQAQISSTEHGARKVTDFHPCFITGLLQTAEYARRLLLTFLPPDKIGPALTARLQRQAVLAETSRQFVFILTDAALRWHSGDPSMLTAQLHHIISVATLPNVTIWVIPADAAMHTPPVGSFVLYEERDDGQPPMAGVETVHHRLEVSGDDDIAAYYDEIAALRRSALDGDDAIQYIRDLAARLTTPPG